MLSGNTRTQPTRTHDSYTICCDIRGVYWKTGGELGRIENAANTGDDSLMPLQSASEAENSLL